MSIATLLDALRQDPEFMGLLTAWQALPAQPARAVPLPTEVDARLAAALGRLGVTELYTHQAAAWRLARQGQHLAVVTPTASGKTLCYNLPVLQALLEDAQARALYLFPTKALAQDQLAELKGIELQRSEVRGHTVPKGHRPGAERSEGNESWLVPATFDGDTPARDRRSVREHARIVLSNPDMLHTGILPHHTRWADFFGHLRFVVVDEMHAYRGVFGSHVANVLRRLRRICRFYGSEPLFIAASATIANARELAERLVEAPVALVDEDGSPRGPRHFLFYNPPLVDPALGLRRSSTLEAERIASRLLAAGVQTIVFARARLTVELLLTYLRQRLANQQISESPDSEVRPFIQSPIDQSTNSSIRGYRGGYLPQERRAIEQGLRDGSVRAVVATNALELGIDIGGLDAAVLTGFPGTIASTWQQAGRAGRRGDAPSLAVLVATAGALDQYIIRHPQYFFGRSPEHALVNPDNLVILSSHLACAAFELPFAAGEPFGSVDYVDDVLAYLAETGEVQLHGGRWYWMGETYPAAAISLRTASPDNIVIHAAPAEPRGADPTDLERTRATVIGEMEREMAPLLLHQGAVYWHEGRSYLVARLDWEAGQAWVTPAAVDYYTQAGSSHQVRILGIHEEANVGGVFRACGPVEIISQTTAFRQVKLHTHETLGYGVIDLPERVLETEAYWLAFTETLLEPLRAAGLWRSDPNDYGPNWLQQRQAARARDGYRCTHCGGTERPGRQHDVHHVRAFRSFGYRAGANEHYREANRLENLVTLCRSCHGLVERGQRLRTGLGGLAYALGNVAPLHLMCDPGDIGVISEAAGPYRPRGDGEANGSPLASPATLPTITIYERAPAGIGFSQRLFELHADLLQAAAEVVAGCDCGFGCPACVGPAPEDVEGDIDPKALTLALAQACLGDGPGALGGG